MDCEYHDAPGDPIAIDELSSGKSIELAEFISSEEVDHFELLECRRDGDADVLVVNVEPEVPQHPVNEIHRCERIAITFDHEDRKHQKVISLRRSFPRVMHTNVTPADAPVDLCLYEISYSELRLRWTAPRFVRQLFDWLVKTARGELHNEDQPLEQTFHWNA